MQALIQAVLRAAWDLTEGLRRPLQEKTAQWMHHRCQEALGPQLAQQTLELQMQRQLLLQVLQLLHTLQTRLPHNPIPDDLNVTLDEVVRELVRLQVQVEALAPRLRSEDSISAAA